MTVSKAGLISFRTPLALLRGVGSERLALLQKLGLLTVGDLLLHRPRRYEDRRNLKAVCDLVAGEQSVVQGTVVGMGKKRLRGGRRTLFELVLEDGTGKLRCRWWNAPYMEQFFSKGEFIVAYGKVSKTSPLAMDHPETEVAEADEETNVHLKRIVPIYPSTEGLTQRWLRALIWRLLTREEIEYPAEVSYQEFPDYPSYREAVRMLHAPEASEEAAVSRQRFALQELLELQLDIQRRRQKLESYAQSMPCCGDNRWIRPFLSSLAFDLTSAQTAVLREIRADLAQGPPMRRLLQGDVGAGKTVVAACAALMVLESGFDVALMAPTEILAEQHAATFHHGFRDFGIGLHLLTGNQTSDLTGNVMLPVTAPEMIIGTHSLLTEKYRPRKLGLVIIDEQHKFGVGQRERLVRKGKHPHLLVMTATPIPRSLGLTLYGDLDISLLQERPPGRGQVRTHVRTAEKFPKVIEFLRRELSRGRQAYVVYPRVEEGNDTDLKSVVTGYRQLKAALAPHSVGLAHGHMNAEERQVALDLFRRGLLKVLVATTVIEVGVDVPNATLMVIEHADRFGLAQLHQLRGRIGRGAENAHCILIAESRTSQAQKRLKVLEETDDGFRIAEMDLALRGPGDFLGREQSGLPPFRFVELAEDQALAEKAKQKAKELVRSSQTGPGGIESGI